MTFVPFALQQAALSVVPALACGALVGWERRRRLRMAGLRIHALVALGAAAFVTFSTFILDDVPLTRVAAQVVSGIGIPGDGIISRDGFAIHGINTASTPWCSASVGLTPAALEQALARVAAEPGPARARWQAVDDS